MSNETGACTACGEPIELYEVCTAEVRTEDLENCSGPIPNTKLVAQYHQLCAPVVLCCTVCDKPYGICMGHPDL